MIAKQMPWFLSCIVLFALDFPAFATPQQKACQDRCAARFRKEKQLWISRKAQCWRTYQAIVSRCQNSCKSHPQRNQCTNQCSSVFTDIAENCGNYAKIISDVDGLQTSCMSACGNPAAIASYNAENVCFEAFHTMADKAYFCISSEASKTNQCMLQKKTLCRRLKKSRQLVCHQLLPSECRRETNTDRCGQLVSATKQQYYRCSAAKKRR